jgi:hypothetical protein
VPETVARTDATEGVALDPGGGDEEAATSSRGVGAPVDTGFLRVPLPLMLHLRLAKSAGFTFRPSEASRVPVGTPVVCDLRLRTAAIDVGGSNLLGLGVGPPPFWVGDAAIRMDSEGRAADSSGRSGEP